MQLREINLLLTGEPETIKGSTLLDLRLNIQVSKNTLTEYKMTNWFSKPKIFHRIYEWHSIQYLSNAEI